MPTLTLYIDERQAQRLDQETAVTGQTRGTYIREAIDRKISTQLTGTEDEATREEKAADAGAE
jgi:predicted DNA-binding protein